MVDISEWPLSSGIRSKTLRVINLDVHYLQALPAASSLPVPKPSLVVLLHGFPELAYSWRKIMVPLSAQGYNVVAPDQRGYGRTIMHDSSREPIEPIHFEDDLAPFRMLNLVADIVMFVDALGYETVAAVVGHDFGSLVAGYCALIRPDIFRSVVLMSAPFPGSPPLPSRDNTTSSLLGPSASLISKQLAELDVPRKHYTLYYSTPHANTDMLRPPQGLHSFFRDYFHSKSAGYPENTPHRLPSASASNLAVLPHYYIMLLEQTMPMAVKDAARSIREGGRSSDSWLSEEELAVYVSEYSRTGFQGGLNWYRCLTEIRATDDMRVFSGKRITVPAMFVSGRHDWGNYQSPGALEMMKERVCQRMDEDDLVLVADAGHWVQQEQNEAVVQHLLRFLDKCKQPA